MSKPAKIFLTVFLSLFGLGLLSAGAFALYVYKLSGELPSVEEMASFKYNEPMVVYDASGTVIAELGPERRYPISIELMPAYMGQAVVAVEDSRFYEHSGVDLWGIARAFVTNIKAGRVVEGGSTLTQQLVKILYLTPEKKLKRKLKEAIMAYQIDRYLTKENILELYLNQVNFGRGAYGVQAAAINYFGKNAQDLTLAEAALIAGIPKAPGLYAPHINMARAVARRNHVLYRMYEVGYITEDEYKAALEEPVSLVDSVPLKLKYAGYFMDFVHKYLSDELKIKDPQNLGLKIYTTLRLDYQLEAEKAVRENLMALAKKEGYAGPVGQYAEPAPETIPAVIEGDETGGEDIIGLKEPSEEELLETPSYLASMGIEKAVVKKVDVNSAELDVNGKKGVLNLKDNEWARPAGDSASKLADLRLILKENDIIYVSRDKKDEELFYLEQDPEIEGALVSVNPRTGEIYAMVGGFSYDKSFFNRAVQARRQMGSIFKPIVYAAAFESGFVPMDTVLDVPVISEEEEGDKVWKPKNYEDKFYGVTTLKEALVKSRNIVTIKVAEQIGIRKIIRYANKFGITSEMPPDLSVSLGSASASPLEMAYAYSVFAGEGARPATPYFITRIEDIDGNVLYEFVPPDPVQVLEKPTAYIMNEMLVNVIEQGSGWRAKAVQRKVGGKTGTTNDSKDAWFGGFLPNIVTVAWVGYDDFRKMGGYATGSSAAAPVWTAYMKEIVKNMPFEMFAVSDGAGYFKVDSKTKRITDSVTGDYTFEIYPVDEQGRPSKIVK